MKFIKSLLPSVFKQDAPHELVLDNIRDAVVLTNSKGDVTYCNRAFLNMVNMDCSTSVIGKSVFHFSAIFSDQLELKAALEGRSSPARIEFPVRAADGTLALTEGVIALGVSGSMFILEDHSVHKEREGRLIRDAKIDKLTGLLNRKGFDERLAGVFDNFKSNGGFGVGVVFIDLDAFKPINDTYGHDVGDLVLVRVAERIQSALDDYETAARLGGDEFVCIYPVCESKNELLKKATRLLEHVARPIEVQGLDVNSLVVRCSIGGALIDESTPTPELLIKRADAAMYEAKGAGKNQVRVD